jgi:hypothetical protein
MCNTLENNDYGLLVREPALSETTQKSDSKHLLKNKFETFWQGNLPLIFNFSLLFINIASRYC